LAQREEEIQKTLELMKQTLISLDKQCQTSQTSLQKSFAAMKEALDMRCAQLLGEIEDQKNLKQKELEIQRQDLQLVFDGIRYSSEFTKKMIDKGNDLEVFLSKKPVLERLNFLQTTKLEFTPVHDEVVEYIEIEKESLLSTIKKFGLVNTNQRSAQDFKIETVQANASYELDKPVTFMIKSLVNDEKMKEQAKRGGAQFGVTIKGPSGIQVGQFKKKNNNP